LKALNGEKLWFSFDSGRVSCFARGEQDYQPDQAAVRQPEGAGRAWKPCGCQSAEGWRKTELACTRMRIGSMEGARGKYWGVWQKTLHRP